MVPKLPKHLEDLQKNPLGSQVSYLPGAGHGERGLPLPGAAVLWCWGRQQVPPPEQVPALGGEAPSLLMEQ